MYFLANFQFVSMTPMLEKILNTVGQNLHTNLGAYNYDCLLSAKIGSKMSKFTNNYKLENATFALSGPIFKIQNRSTGKATNK